MRIESNLVKHRHQISCCFLIWPLKQTRELLDKFSQYPYGYNDQVSYRSLPSLSIAPKNSDPIELLARIELSYGACPPRFEFARDFGLECIV